MELGTEGWLDRIAATSSDAAALTQTYDEWAAHYEADVLVTGYRNPAVVAALAARYVPVPGAVILDAGAGTGILGHILHIVGYTDLTAIDASAGMLAQASALGIYRELHHGRLGEPLAFDDGRFTAAVALNVFAFGHAPPDALDELVRVTRPGGILVFNINEGPWEQAGFREKVAALTAAARWELLEVVGPYRPMPLSPTRTHSGRTFAFRVR